MYAHCVAVPQFDGAGLQDPRTVELSTLTFATNRGFQQSAKEEKYPYLHICALMARFVFLRALALRILSAPLDLAPNENLKKFVVLRRLKHQRTNHACVMRSGV